MYAFLEKIVNCGGLHVIASFPFDHAQSDHNITIRQKIQKDTIQVPRLICHDITETGNVEW